MFAPSVNWDKVFENIEDTRKFYIEVSKEDESSISS